MGQLFSSNKIETFFQKVSKKVLEEINSEKETTLDNDVKLSEFKIRIEQSNKVKELKLNVEETITEIREELVNSHQFPAGTVFSSHGPKKIEIALYKIPFEGSSDLFNYQPTTFTNRAIMGEIGNGFILMKLTNYGMITGNIDVQNELSKRVNTEVNNINNMLEYININVKQFNDKLPQYINDMIDQRVQEINLKKAAVNNINPFKRS